MFALATLFQAHEEKSFLSWMRETNSLYTGEEYALRFGIWSSNQRLVQEHNKAKNFRVTMNKFAAMTQAEYKALLGHRSSARIDGPVRKAKPTNEAEVDWRTHGIVNEVKDQASCGSCWAFSVVQSMESVWAKAHGELPYLSEQNLVDCVTSCYGCNGGDEYVSYVYILKYQDGLWETEANYPYTAKDGTCKFDKTRGVCKFADWYRPTTTQNEEELANDCAANGPISVAMDASNWSFQLYSGGIYDEPSCSATWLNHAVGLVGYGTESGTGYWIIRNSWGKSWGEAGYIRMLKNGKNQCGIATDVVIPTL